MMRGEGMGEEWSGDEESKCERGGMEKMKKVGETQTGRSGRVMGG